MVEQWEVGSRVQVTTSQSEEITGCVYAVDEATEFLLLVVEKESEKPIPGRSGGEFRFLQLSAIKSHKYLGDTGLYSGDEFLPEVDTGKLSARFNEAIARIGAGASTKGQRVFDILSKTMPCRWNETSIVVMDVVQVHDPYAVDNVVGSDKNLKERVCAILNHAAEKEARA